MNAPLVKPRLCADASSFASLRSALHGALGTGYKHISRVDADGVALAAIQGLRQVVQEKDARIAALERAVAEMTRRLEALGTKP
jgi:hypothetical protein